MMHRTNFSPTLPDGKPPARFPRPAPPVLFGLGAIFLSVSICLPAGAGDKSSAGIDDATLAAIRTWQFDAPYAPLRQAAELVRRTSADVSARRRLAKRLRPLLTDKDATKDAKRFVCRQLALIGAAEDVPALAALLTDPDLSHMARYALERIPGPEATAALVSALPKTPGPLRVGIINSLGERRDPAAVPALIPFLRTPQDAETARAAAAALAKIGTPECFQALARSRSTWPAALKSALFDALCVCAVHLKEPAARKAALPILDDIRRNAASPHVRTAALDAYIRVSGADSAPFLVKLLTSSDPGVQSIALRYVRELPGRDTTLAFAAQVPRIPEPARVQLILALGERGDRAAAPAVLKQTGSPNSEVRRAALYALAAIGGPDCIPTLVRIAAETTGVEQREARSALTRISGRDADRALLDMLSRAAAKEQVEILRAATARRLAEVVRPALRLARRSPSSAVRTAALKAIGAVAGPDRLDDLLELIRNAPDDATAEAACRALVSVSRRAETPSGAPAARIARALSKAPDTRKPLLLGALGRLGGPHALAAVRNALASGRPALVTAAYRALSTWPDDAALPFLLELARTTSDPTHRILVFRGLAGVLKQSASRPEIKTEAVFRAAFNAARTTDELRLVLGAAGSARCSRLLPVVGSFIARKEVEAEAVAALCALARATADADRPAAKSALQAAFRSTTDPDAAAQLERALNEIRSYEDFVTFWEIAGPYTRNKMKNRQLFDVVFPPEPDAPSKKRAKVHWRLHRPPSTPSQAWIIELDKILGGSNRAAYLRTWLWSRTPHKVRFSIGSDDGVKVWVNGCLVHKNNVNRALAPDQDVVDVNLAAGWNEVLLKITQGAGQWSACLRVRTPSGESDPDVLFFGDPRALDAGVNALAAGSAKTASRRRDLAVLARWPDQCALLEALAPHLDGASREVLELAVHAGTACSSAPHFAASVLRRIARTAPADLRKAAHDALVEVSTKLGYVKIWLVSGPYPAESGDAAFDKVFPPEPGGRGRVAPWRMVDLGDANDVKGCVLDLNALFGRREHCVAFLRTVLYCPVETDAFFEIGSDDGVKVWLNDVLVHANNVMRPIKLREDKVPVHLRKGWNGVLMKITQGGGDWGACLRIAGRDGGSIPGLCAELCGQRRVIWPDAGGSR